MAAGSLLLLCAAVTRVRADDWLAVLPECAIAGSSRPELTLLYPSHELPAVVRAGDVLVVRVRTPAALTPPPGVQQQGVLAKYWAELSAGAPRVGVAERHLQHHLLAVTSVRPDGASSLIYRMRVQLPAYLAPGTYTLSLRTPFGFRSAERAVRVIPAGSQPRMQRLPEPFTAPPAAAASWPVDVWLASAQPSAAEAIELEAPLAPAPVLGAQGPALALRIGGELWVRSGCSDARAFERELQDVLAREGLRRVELAEERLAPPPSAAAIERPPRFSLVADGAQLDNREREVASELSLLVPFEPGLQVEGGALELFPASEPSARRPVAKLARWRVPAGVNASLRIAPPREPVELALLAGGVQSGQPARLRIQGAERGARVAYTLGFARSAYGSGELRTSFGGPLKQPVEAQIFAAGGEGQVAHGHLWVEPYRPPNCAIAQPLRERSGRPRWPLWGVMLLVCARQLAKKARARGKSE